MPDITWTHPGLNRMLDAIPISVTSVLDAGCGPGIVGALCRIYREPERLVAVEIHRPYLERVRELRLYDEFVERSLTEPLPFGDDEFDVASCLEVIEHLEKEDGRRLLGELERVARRVVVSTPNWFFEQDEFDHNPHQRHRSLWRAREFQDRGYRVTGVGGMKVFGRHVPVVSTLLGPVTLRLPRLSTMIVCVKDT